MRMILIVILSGNHQLVLHLFDFNCSHWVDIHAGPTICSFDEELQLYGMLNLDVEGEGDVDVDVQGTC